MSTTTHGTWEALDSRKGQLQEMSAALRRVKRTVSAVRRDDPAEHPVGDLLDTAFAALTRAAIELEWAAEHVVDQ